MARGVARLYVVETLSPVFFVAFLQGRNKVHKSICVGGGCG